jgi:prophage regulatory protein
MPSHNRVSARRAVPPADAGGVNPFPKFLFENELVERLRLSPCAIARMEDRGQFPKRVKLASRRVAWIEAEVLDWLANRMAARAA